MARAVDNRPQSANSDGFNQATGTKVVHAPTPADGCTVTGLPDSTVNSAAQSPGAVLGTGQNPDRYTPVVEAV